MSEIPSFYPEAAKNSAHLAEVLAFLRKLGFNHASDYDEEFFKEAYEVIEGELASADRLTRKRLLTDMYFDCLSPEYVSHGNIFKREFVIAPPHVSFEDARLDEWGVSGGLLSDFRGDTFTHKPWQESRVTQYGSIKISTVFPGGWGMQARDKHAIIGTENLSACQAIVGRDQNRVLVAHSLYGCESDIPEIMRQFRATLSSDARFDFFYPHYEFGEGDQQAGSWKENADMWNRRYVDIASREGMNRRGYYFVRADHNPDDVGASAVLVTEDGIRVVGYRIVYDSLAKQWKQAIRTIQDYD